MEWTQILRSAIEYMEGHIREPISPEDVAAHVYLSPMHLQRGFEIVTGYSISRYLRYRRLYLAALDLAVGHGKVIDIAYRYGFETPESFTKAFTRFHGATPTQIKNDHSRIKTFFPFKITLTVQGGSVMEFTVEKLEHFALVGFEREIAFDAGYRDCPEFWEEFSAGYLQPLFSGKDPETEEERAVRAYRIGEFGACLDNGEKPGVFQYMIAGEYRGGPVPETMKVIRFPDLEWAKFPCHGPLPGALQSVNTQIFKEWLPGNPDYEIAMAANLEWYAPGGETDGTDYESAIWIPVKRKTV